MRPLWVALALLWTACGPRAYYRPEDAARAFAELQCGEFCQARGVDRVIWSEGDRAACVCR